MRDGTEHSQASQQYAAAYAIQYTTKDLHEALKLHNAVMTEHPDTPEAGYSRMQIMNIASSVVPKQVLLDSQLELALRHVEHV